MKTKSEFSVVKRTFSELRKGDVVLGEPNLRIRSVRHERNRAVVRFEDTTGETVYDGLVDCVVAPKVDLERIYNVLRTGSFATWHATVFESHIRWDDNASSKEEILEDLRQLFCE